MADISQEIDQLRNAVYGEEVRGAFISCMQKIHEENESYNSIKESVKQSAATMQEQVESINTKSEEVKAALQNLTIAIANGKAQQDANEKATEILINQVNTIAFQINPDDKGLDAIILSA